MLKRLILRDNRGGGGLLYAAIVPAIAIPAGNARALSVSCADSNFNPVACGTPAAVRCEYPSPAFIGECQSLGYSDPGDTFGYMCVEATCSTAPVAVAELEDYAAAAFLALALVTGLRVRRLCRRA